MTTLSNGATTARFHFRRRAILPAIACCAAIGIGTALLTASPAVAEDDDTDVICFDYEVNGKSVIECQTVAELTAECAKTDPEFTTDICQQLLENRVPRGLGLTTEQKKRKPKIVIDRGDHDKGRGSDGGGRDHDRDDGGRGSGPNG